MAGSDNTCYGHQASSAGRLARLRGYLTDRPKHKQFLEDVAGAGLLAVVVWLLYLIGGLMQP